MALELPSLYAEATGRLIGWGAELVPPLGGPTQRIDRLGTRFSWDFTLRPEPIAAEGRQYISRIRRALLEGAIVTIPQVDLTIGSVGTPLVNTAVSGGKVVSVKGLPAAKQLVEGQYITFIHGGKRYLHSIDTTATANGAGVISLTITPMLRVNLSVNDVVEIATPKMEGLLSGNDWEWTLDVSKHVGLSFTVTETE